MGRGLTAPSLFDGDDSIGVFLDLVLEDLPDEWVLTRLVDLASDRRCVSFESETDFCFCEFDVDHSCSDWCVAQCGRC